MKLYLHHAMFKYLFEKFGVLLQGSFQEPSFSVNKIENGQMISN